jgi:hypothetical protein
MADSNFFSEALPEGRALWMHPSARAAAWHARNREGLAGGILHPSVHYAGAEQARLWEVVHRTHAPGAFLEFYRHFFKTLVPMRAIPGSFALLALGAATAAKETLFLEACRQEGKRAAAGAACDIGAELALHAGEVLSAAAGCPIQAVAVSWDRVPWREAVPRIGGPVVATAFGVLPNLLPAEAARSLAGPLRPGEVLVASAHLAPVGAGGAPDLARIAPQYDNPETRAWLRRWLVEQGLEAEYPELEFRDTLVEGMPAFVFEARRWPGGRGTLPESLRLFYSLRPVPAMVDQWAESCGLECAGKAIHPSGEEGLWCWRKR